MSRIRILLELTKFPIAALSTLTAITGHIVFKRTLVPGLLSTCLGVLLVALGACALNQWQDRDLDARMERTRDRPLPAGRLHPRVALVTAALLLLGGFGLLAGLHGLSAALLAALAVAWYNGLYTYLKRVSAFAVVPGAVIGALPPVIGWTAAGGEPLDPHVLSLAFFFFLWQVPHFWLLLLVHGDDYRRAGLPSLTMVLSQAQLGRLTFTWMVGTAASSLLLRVYGLVASPYVALGIAVAGLWLIWRGAFLVKLRGDMYSVRIAFGGINLYAVGIMGLLVLDALM